MLPLYRSKFCIFNYNEIPKGYYFKVMNHGSKVQRFWHKFKFLECVQKVNKDDDLMDFGCGPGSFLYQLTKEGDFKSAVGTDLASNQIEFAKETLTDKRISFVGLPQDQTDLPFKTDQFSKICSIEVVEHIHPYYVGKILEEFKRQLKDDGTIILTTPNYRSLWPFIEYILNRVSPVKYHEQHINKFTPNSFIKFVETMGFEVKNLYSIFIISPFLAPISERLAKFVMKIEKKFLPMLGSLLVLEMKKANLD